MQYFDCLCVKSKLENKDKRPEVLFSKGDSDFQIGYHPPVSDKEC